MTKTLCKYCAEHLDCELYNGEWACKSCREIQRLSPTETICDLCAECQICTWYGGERLCDDCLASEKRYDEEEEE